MFLTGERSNPKNELIIGCPTNPMQDEIKESDYCFVSRNTDAMEHCH
jgi:hypothetical protein